MVLQISRLCSSRAWWPPAPTFCQLENTPSLTQWYAGHPRFYRFRELGALQWTLEHSLEYNNALFVSSCWILIITLQSCKCHLILTILSAYRSSGKVIYHLKFLMWFRYFINPLSTNIHINILQTVFHTFPWRISWENLLTDQSTFPWWSIK